jgi:DNA polymerase-3 subunit gamma/tau
MLNIINKSELSYKQSKNQRLLVELCLIQLCNLGLAPYTSASSEEKKNDVSVQSQTSVEIKKPDSTPISSNSSEQVQVNNSNYSVNLNTDDSINSAEKQPIAKTNSLASFKNLKGSNPLSLNTIQKKEEQKQVQNSEELLNIKGPETAFTIDDLIKQIQLYAKSDKVAGKKTLEFALLSNKPEIKEQSLILITVENEVQRNALRTELTDFTMFLRNKLNNFKITINIEVAKGDTAKKGYTPRERFQKMAEKNPNLITLYNKLDLDLEF